MSFPVKFVWFKELGLVFQLGVSRSIGGNNDDDDKDG